MIFSLYVNGEFTHPPMNFPVQIHGLELGFSLKVRFISVLFFFRQTKNTNRHFLVEVLRLKTDTALKIKQNCFYIILKMEMKVVEDLKARLQVAPLSEYPKIYSEVSQLRTQLKKLETYINQMMSLNTWLTMTT